MVKTSVEFRPLEMKVLLYLIGLGLCKGQNGNPRSVELSCWECASKHSNDTCTDEFRKSVKILGFDKRCRIMEMNGKVVSQGVVPKVLCTPGALAKVSDLFSKKGPIWTHKRCNLLNVCLL